MPNRPITASKASSPELEGAEDVFDQRSEGLVERDVGSSSEPEQSRRMGPAHQLVLLPTTRPTPKW
jgi:hypothetical protein